MSIYYFLFFFFFAISFIEVVGVKIRRDYKRIIIFIVFVFLIVLSTIYYGPVGDLYEYENYFYNVKLSHLLHPTKPFEKGYILLNAVLRLFSDQYWVLRLVLAIIVVAFWKKIIISKDDNFLLGKEFLALFCLWALKNGNIFIVRSSIAVVILIYSIRYIENKNFNKFFLMVFIAFMFHTIAIVFIPAYWLYHWKTSRKYLYLLIILAAIMSPVLPKIITYFAGFIPFTYIRSKIIHYINDSGLISYTNLSYGQHLLKAMINMGSSVIMFEFISRNTNKMNDRFEGRLNLYTLGVLIYMIAINVSTGLTRAALPYMDMQIIMLPQLFECPFAKKNYTNRMILFVTFSLYLFLRMYVNLDGLEYTTMFFH